MAVGALWPWLWLYKAFARFPLTRRQAGRSFSKLCSSTTRPVQIDHHIATRPVRLDLNAGIDRSIYLHGVADRRGVLAMVGVLKRISPRTAWDIGANRGNHAAYIRLYSRRLFCFEPNPAEYVRLLDLFDGDDGVVAMPVALSDVTGTKPFFRDDTESGNSTLEVDAEKANEIVPVKRGDDITSEYAVSDLDFIKLDVEGHEENVLRGLSSSLERQRPIIIFEVLQAKADGEVIRKLLPPRYRLYGNTTTLWSGIFMTAYQFVCFEDDQTYMSAIAIPEEKVGLLKDLLPR